VAIAAATRMVALLNFCIFFLSVSTILNANSILGERHVDRPAKHNGILHEGKWFADEKFMIQSYVKEL